MSTYAYLKKYVAKSPGQETEEQQWNSFYPVSEKEIEAAEKDIGQAFPSQLRSFYKEVGYGFLCAPEKPPEGYDFSSTNRINTPGMIRDIIIEGSESEMILPDAVDLFEPGELPFFEIADSSSFMVMKPQSDNPNAVWYMGYEKVEDSFERFIYNLYHKDPAYYTEGWPEEDLT